MALIESYEGDALVSIDPFYIVRKILKIPETVKGIKLLRRLQKEVRIPLLHVDLNVVKAAITQADFEGLEELRRILKDPKQVEDILNRAYKHVRKLLQDYLRQNDADVMISTSVNYRQKFVSLTDWAGGKHWEKPADNPRNYTGLWDKIVKQIIGPATLVEPGLIRSFSFEDIVAVKIPPPTRSKFTSVFMMEEFGTGQEADPELRRPFTSFASTPFKVPPELAKGSGGERNTQYLWWPVLPWQAYALRLASAFKSKNKFILTLTIREKFIKEARRLNTQLSKFGLSKHRSLTEMRKWAERTYRRYDRYSKIEKKGEERQYAPYTPIQLAYGFKRGHSHPGRQARHLFFDTRRGIVQKMREFQEDGQKEIARQIDIKIQKVKKGKFKDFPSVYRIIFGGG